MVILSRAIGVVMVIGWVAMDKTIRVIFYLIGDMDLGYLIKEMEIYLKVFS